MIVGWRPAYDEAELTHNQEERETIGTCVKVDGKPIASVYWIVGTRDIKVRHKRRLGKRDREAIEKALERLKARLAAAASS